MEFRRRILTQENDEGCQLQKPHMKNDENKEQIIDPTMNIIFIFYFQKVIIVVVRNLGCKNRQMICQEYRLN